MPEPGIDDALAAIEALLDRGELQAAHKRLMQLVEQAPRSAQAWQMMGRLMVQLGAFDKAGDAFENAAGLVPGDAAAWSRLGQSRQRAREAEKALEAYDRALSLRRDHPADLLGRGHALRALGRRDEAIAAYRGAIAIRPGFGEAWWSLANLKTERFSTQDLSALQAALGGAKSAPLQYALGKALEDHGRYDAAFAAYEAGGRMRLAERPYDPAGDEARGKMMADHCTRAALERVIARGTGSVRPIFIVGLPRSGSTLLEQILASHPNVSPADEPPYLGQVASALGQFPINLDTLTTDQMQAAGRTYLERLARHGDGKRVIIDKNPHNFWLVGLVQAALPDATIIDARRDPRDALTSAFCQLFETGFNHTSTLEHLGRHWQTYNRLMTHWDTELSGRVHRFDYEALIADQEGETRRLLAVCGLDWDPACLDYHRADHAVHTASSEQVRQPLHSGSIGRWKQFEQHLVSLDQWLPPD